MVRAITHVDRLMCTTCAFSLMSHYSRFRLHSCTNHTINIDYGFMLLKMYLCVCVCVRRNEIITLLLNSYVEQGFGAHNRGNIENVNFDSGHIRIHCMNKNGGHLHNFPHKII